MIRRFALALSCILIGLSGCSRADSAAAEHPRRMAHPSNARFGTTPPDQAFAAAAYALRQWFPRLDERPAEGRIIGHAVEYDQRGGTERLRDVVGPRNRMRRSGVIEVHGLGQGAEAQCIINVEKLDTAEYRAMHREQNRFEDAPTDTPIDRDAGITSQQQQVWTPMPRDRALEREILDVIRARLEDGEAVTKPASTGR